MLSWFEHEKSFINLGALSVIDGHSMTSTGFNVSSGAKLTDQTVRLRNLI